MSEEQQEEQAPQQLAPVQTEPPGNPFPNRRDLSAGAAEGNIAIESERAIAEAQGKLVVAKRFPRDRYQAMEQVLDACKRKQFASSAIYSYTRGEKVSGPSIRLAEELARCWGNVEYGLRELSNQPGYSEMEAYAWDLETNTYSAQRFTVRHIRERQQGDKELTGQRDIYEITANMGARRMRARILAILPDDYVDAAEQQCRLTIQEGSDEPLSARIERMRRAFERFNVTTQQLERYLGHKLGETTVDEIPDLQGVFNAIKDGNSKVGDFFGAAPLAGAQQGEGEGDAKPAAASKKKAAAKKTASKKKAAAAAQPKTEPEPPQDPPEDPGNAGDDAHEGEGEDEAPGLAEPQGEQQQPAGGGANKEDLF